MKKAIFFCSILFLVFSLYTDGSPSDLPDSNVTEPINVTGQLDNEVFRIVMNLETTTTQPHQDEETETDNKNYRPPKICTFQGKIGIYNKCKSFYACSRPGATPVETDCKDEKLFDQQYRECKNMTVSECKDTQCKNSTLTFPDPYHRESYLTCENLYPEVAHCPHGQIWNKVDKTCKDGDRLEGYIRSDEEEKDRKNSKRKIRRRKL